MLGTARGGLGQAGKGYLSVALLRLRREGEHGYGSHVGGKLLGGHAGKGLRIPHHLLRHVCRPGWPARTPAR